MKNVDGSAQRQNQFPHHPGAMVGCLFDFEAFPGRYALALRQPRKLFDHVSELLTLASGRTLEGLPTDADLEARLRQAARFFVRTALLRPGVDYYTLLGVTPAFDPATLRDNYRLLMRLTHPDFAGEGNDWPADAATRINQAHDVLSSTVRRQEYDRSLTAGRRWVPPVAAHAVPVLPQRFVRPRPTDGTNPRSGRVAAVLAAVGGMVALAVWVLVESSNPEPATSLAGLSTAVPVDQVALQYTVPVPQGNPDGGPQEVSLAAPDAPPVAAVTPPMPVPVPTPVPTPVPAPVPAPTPVPVPAPVPAPAPVRAVAPAPRPVVVARAPMAPRALRPIASPAALVVQPAASPVTSMQPSPVLLAAVVPASVPPPTTLPVVAPVAVAAPVAVVVAVASPVPVVTTSQTAAATAPRPAGAPVQAEASGGANRVTMADVQPLLAQVMGVLQSGRGEQVLRWVDRSARQGDGADGFVQVYNRVVGNSRSVRLGPVRFSGHSVGDQLTVDGVVRLHLLDESEQAVTRELVLRAQFASRRGQTVLTQLGASESAR